MQETKTKACNYIPIYLFQSSTVSSQYNYPLCQTYILLLYCFHETLPLLPLGFMQETYLFHLQVWLHLVFCSLNAQCFYACNTLCSYGYEVPVTTNAITWMQIQQSNFNVSHYLHKLNRFVLHGTLLSNNSFYYMWRLFFHKPVLQGGKKVRSCETKVP